MDCRKVNKGFRVVDIKGGGAYANFGTEVPKLAQQFLTRLGEVEYHTGTEIALFEPKRDANQQEGHIIKFMDFLKQNPDFLNKSRRSGFFYFIIDSSLAIFLLVLP